MQLVARKRVKHVVALKLDRLFRDAEDVLYQTKAWDRAGVASTWWIWGVGSEYGTSSRPVFPERDGRLC